MVQDSITIDGVTISREQWEVFHVAYTLYAAHLTWESFVAANAKSEHYNGEPCTLPVYREDLERAKVFRFEYTGKLVGPSSTLCWYEAPSGASIMWNRPPEPRWELRAISNYKVGDWVVLSGFEPVQVKRIDGHTVGLNTQLIDVSLIRPATREDFMVEFGGIKVWMEEHPELAQFRFKVCHEDTETTEYGFFGTPPWKVEVYKAAGVMLMPKEFWKEK